MNLQAEDKSNKALTVGSLNVLGGMKSDELTSIHTHLQTQDGVQSRIIADIQKLHESISADGVITANEKQMLKKELFIIESEYPLIITKSEATKKSKTDIEAYKEAFQKLQHYIYSELKVFDSMQTALEIERNTFNAFFAAYYSSRSLLQITQDGSTKFLPSLEVQGDYENQIGTFQGRLYRWTGSKWELLNAVMPLNPVCHYDMAEVQYSDISLLEFSNYTLQANTPDGYGILDILKYCKNGHCYELSADFVATKGNPSHASIYYYDFDAGGQWGDSITEHNTPVVDGKCRAFIRFIKQEIPNHNIKMLFYPGKAGDTQGVEAYYKSFSLKHLDQIAIDASGNNNHATIIGDVEKIKDDKIGAALKFNKGYLKRTMNNLIGLGKKWTHSRIIKIDTTQSEKIARLWFYYWFDWCRLYYSESGKLLDIVTGGGFNSNSVDFSFSIPNMLADGNSHTLTVMNDLQPAYFEKWVYIDGKLAAHKRAVGDFSTTYPFTYGFDMRDQTDEYYCNGSLANLLFFDRLLTEQEILYLYLNPQYPVKNYTAADWAIDPDNPNSSIKNLTPKYLGVVETVPTTRTAYITKGEKLGAQDANAGDWVLMAKTLGGWKVGVCYRWTGSQWINLEPEYNYTEQYQAALYHICEIPELMQNTGHFGALFAKVLVAQQAFIDKLVAQEAFINQLATEQAFLRQLIVQQLKIDSDTNSHQDFEAWFDQEHGLKINNMGEEIFKVDSAGNVFAKNAFLQDGTFTGEIHSGPLHLSPVQPSARVIDLTTSQTAKDIYLLWKNCSYSVTDKGGNPNIVRFSVTAAPVHDNYYDNLFGVYKKVGEREGVIYTVNIHTNNSTVYKGDFAGYGETTKKWKTKADWWGTIPDIDFSQLNRNLTKNYNLEIVIGGKTFRLEDLPTQAPGLGGCVWKDGNGFLRIS